MLIEFRSKRRIDDLKPSREHPRPQETSSALLRPPLSSSRYIRYECNKDVLTAVWTLRSACRKLVCCFHLKSAPSVSTTTRVQVGR